MGALDSRYIPTAPQPRQPTTLNDRQAEKLQRREAKTLQQFASLLKYMLDSDEKVLLATRACSPFSFGHYLTTGWLIYLLKRCVLIFTNRRVLHVPTTRSYVPRGLVAEADYADIVQAKPGRFFGRTLTVQYRSGRQEMFRQFPSLEHRRLHDLLPTIRFGGGANAQGERRNLCPHCRSALTRNQFVCRSCGVEFKNKRRAAFLSILLPGGGYFYTRHPILGFFDAIVETYLLVFFLLMVAASLVSTGEDAAGATVGAVFIGFVLVIEKLVTLSHAFHFVDEFIPLEKDLTRLQSSGVGAPALSPAP